jgi:hypothetical protein
MTVAFQVSSSAEQIRNDGNHLEIQPILDHDCPRASFCITDGLEESHMAPVMELDMEEIRELREVLGKVEETLEPIYASDSS